MLALRAAHRIGLHGSVPNRGALQRYGLPAPRGFASTAPKLASLSGYRPNIFDPPPAPSPTSASCSSSSDGAYKSSWPGPPRTEVTPSSSSSGSVRFSPPVPSPGKSASPVSQNPDDDSDTALARFGKRAVDHEKLGAERLYATDSALKAVVERMEATDSTVAGLEKRIDATDAVAERHHQESAQRHTESVWALRDHRHVDRRRYELLCEKLGGFQRRQNEAQTGRLNATSSEPEVLEPRTRRLQSILARNPPWLPNASFLKSMATRRCLHADAAASSTPSATSPGSGGSSSGGAGGSSSSGAAGATDSAKSKTGDTPPERSLLKWYIEVPALMIGSLVGTFAAVWFLNRPPGLSWHGISFKWPNINIKWDFSLRMDDRLVMDMLLPLINDPEYETIIPVDAVLRDIREHLRRAPDNETKMFWITRENSFSALAKALKAENEPVTIDWYRKLLCDKRDLSRDPLNRIVLWNAVFGTRDHVFQNESPPPQRAPRVV